MQAVFQSPTPHSPRGFAARLSAPPPKLYFAYAYNTASYAGYFPTGKLITFNWSMVWSESKYLKLRGGVGSEVYLSFEFVQEKIIFSWFVSVSV